MPNDVSYFKLSGDETHYSFNDKDAEARITQLMADLSAESARAQTAEQANAEAIQSENVRALAAEQANAAAIQAETSRAQSAEQANADNISSEVTRAQEVEGELQDLTSEDKSNLVAAINEALAGTALTAVDPTLVEVSGVTLGFLRAYRVGKIALVDLEFTLTGTLSDHTTIASGLPIPADFWWATAHSWAATFKRPCRVQVTTSGNLRLRYGEAGSYDVQIVYPIA